MRIILNGTETEVTAARLDALLAELGYGEAVVATALNGRFVHRSGRASATLRDGDRLEVLAPLPGG